MAPAIPLATPRSAAPRGPCRRKGRAAEPPEPVSGTSILPSTHPPPVPSSQSAPRITWWSLFARLSSRNASPEERPPRLPSPISSQALKSHWRLWSHVRKGVRWRYLTLTSFLGRRGRPQTGLAGTQELAGSGERWDAAPQRSAGAQSRHAGGRERQARGSGRIRRRTPMVSGPPITPQSPRSSAARLLPEGVRGARQLHRRTPGSALSSRLRRLALGISWRTLCPLAYRFVSKPVGTL